MSQDTDSFSPADRLAQARRQFPQYYHLATKEEEAMMDALVLTHVAFQDDVRIPRQTLPPSIRGEVEKMTDAFERLFTVLRETVRASAAFSQVDDSEQAKIERELFDVLAGMTET
jgi:hypothetical protein